MTDPLIKGKLTTTKT